MYGGGVAKLAKQLVVSEREARAVRLAYNRTLPGIRALSLQCQHAPSIRTWGGREYFPQPPVTLANGEVRTFEYKQINTIIQGSAADHLKQALVNYDRHPKRRGRLLLSVHDEILVSVPRAAAKAERRVLDEILTKFDFRVPMRTSIVSGSTWASCG
jgi:DNA polymerase I-like protein with 3'-5' exonuclease and polymerase domains